MKENCGNFLLTTNKVEYLDFNENLSIFLTLSLSIDIDENEANIPFFDHVFLESYLEDFPQVEPIQQFMTLVLNGLSQNSFLDINEKKEIIEWYKKYFEEKLDFIKEALDIEQKEQEYFKK